MQKNMGVLDRGIRLLLGVLLLGLYGALGPPLKYFTLFGLVLVGTALTGVCPAYSLFGISSRKPSSRA